MSEIIKTAMFGEINLDIYRAVYEALDVLNQFEKEFVRLNIPLSFILAPKDISKISEYRLRQFYLDACNTQMRNFSTCENDLESLSDILSIDYDKQPTEEELKIRKELEDLNIVSKKFD